jgi:ABC transport system ATP-binding/permease protein
VTGQQRDYTSASDTTLAISLGRGRHTNRIPPSKLSLSFVGGLCVGQTGLMITNYQTSIGRGEDCDIILDGETVSRVHCEIVRTGTTYLLTDRSRNGTFLNGERVCQAQLHDNDQIRIGQNVMLVHLSSGFKTGLIAGKPTIQQRPSRGIEMRPHIVVKGIEEGVTQPFDDERITIGRRADNHLVLEADNISRRHIAIERRDGGYFVSDLGSANGTYLNDQRVDCVRLNSGDRLRIGNVVLLVNLFEQDCVLNVKKVTR